METGYTTGTCATVTTRASLLALVGNPPHPDVTVDLPCGEQATLEVTREHVGSEQATYSTVKDAGDDPDVTDGARIRTTVLLNRGRGLTFRAGEGVGRVTYPGMPVEVGEPAINPVPRSMMQGVVDELRAHHSIPPNLTLRVAVEKGTELAQRTLNPRLGIKGGLSILGTTGIVEPYSHASYIASIEQGVDVARANGLDELALSTGGRTEKTAMRELDLPDLAFIQFAGFLRETLDYLVDHPVSRLHLYMMPGKFSKLMQGHLELHSRESRVDPEPIRARIADRFALSSDQLETLNKLQTTNQLLSPLDRSQKNQLMEDWVLRGRTILNRHYGGVLPACDMRLVVLDRDGTPLASTEWSL